MANHVHMMISSPPKYAVSRVVGFIKEESAIPLTRGYGERKRDFVGRNFRAGGDQVSSVGRDEGVIRQTLRKRKKGDQWLDKMNLWRSRPP